MTRIFGLTHNKNRDNPATARILIIKEMLNQSVLTPLSERFSRRGIDGCAFVQRFLKINLFNKSGVDILKKKGRIKNESDSEKFLAKILNQRPDFTCGESRITFEIGGGLLIEGVRKICEYTGDRLIIATYSRSIIIEGCCLCICCMMEDSIVICGQISDIKLI